MSQITVYPDPGVGGGNTSFDGFAFIVDAGGQDFGVLRAGNGTGSDATNDFNTAYVRCDSSTDKFDVFSRALNLFDFSAIGVGNTIDGVEIALKPVDQIFNGLSGFVNFVEGESAIETDIANSDYQLNANTTKFSTDKTTNLTLGTYAAFVFNAAGLAYVSSKQGGVLRACLKSTFDIASSAPTWISGVRDGLQSSSADELGTSSDPKATIDYTEGGADEINTFFGYNF